MKKDIHIPKVIEVFVAAVYVFNESFKTYEWNVYLINNQSIPLETVLVVSKGAKKGTSTSVLRKQIKVLPAKSFVKLEYLHEDLRSIENRFLVSFFQGNQLFDKTFCFPAGSIKESDCVQLPQVPEKGILAN